MPSSVPTESPSVFECIILNQVYIGLTTKIKICVKVVDDRSTKDPEGIKSLTKC